MSVTKEGTTDFIKIAVRILLLSAFFAILGGIILAFIGSWMIDFAAQKSPSLLPTPPIKATSIEGINGFSWITTYPSISSDDGVIYSYSWDATVRQDVWGIEKEPKFSISEPCTTAVIKKFKEANGEIIDCHTAQGAGEWCPAPLTSHALTSTGEVWQYTDEVFCGFLVLFLFFYTAIGSFVLSLIVMSIRAVIKSRRNKNKQLTPEVAKIEA